MHKQYTTSYNFIVYYDWKVLSEKLVYMKNLRKPTGIFAKKFVEC